MEEQLESQGLGAADRARRAADSISWECHRRALELLQQWRVAKEGDHVSLCSRIQSVSCQILEIPLHSCEVQLFVDKNRDESSALLHSTRAGSGVKMQLVRHEILGIRDDVIGHLLVPTHGVAENALLPRIRGLLSGFGVDSLWIMLL